MPKRSKKNRKTQKAAKSWFSRNLRLGIYAVIVGGVLGGIYYKILEGHEYPVDLQKISPQDISQLRGNETRATLSPALFVGETTYAYTIAKQNRELLDSMYCYCYCEKTIGHKSLLSCYADRHAASCGICRDQAIFAFEHYQNGDAILQIRTAMDKKFWRPFG